MSLSDFQPRIAHYAERVRASFDAQPFGQHIGMELAAVRPGYAECRLRRRPELTQQLGYIHGSLLGALADNAAGIALMTLLAENEGMVTVEYKINFLTPATSEWLVARGQVLRTGKQLSVSRADLYCGDDAESGVLCATGLFTLMTLRF
jgi:uncharacterized protein (TIGR00369 family)